MSKLPGQISHNTKTTDLMVQRDGSGEFWFHCRGNRQMVTLNQMQLFDLYQFFKLPGVAQMIEEAFLAEQQEIEQLMHEDELQVARQRMAATV